MASVTRCKIEFGIQLWWLGRRAGECVTTQYLIETSAGPWADHSGCWCRPSQAGTPRWLPPVRRAEDTTAVRNKGTCSSLHLVVKQTSINTPEESWQQKIRDLGEAESSRTEDSPRASCLHIQPAQHRCPARATSGQQFQLHKTQILQYYTAVNKLNLVPEVHTKMNVRWEHSQITDDFPLVHLTTWKALWVIISPHPRAPFKQKKIPRVILSCKKLIIL